MEHSTVNSFSAIMVLSKAHKQNQLLQRWLGLSSEPRTQHSLETSHSFLNGEKEKRKKTVVFFMKFQVYFPP